MQFDKTYWTAMDKEAAQQYLVGPSYLGISTPPFEKQLDALQARIFEGTQNVELGFMGTGKGSVQGGNITPEMHSRQERDDMRQLAKFNKVELSTHASPRMGALSGLGEKGFSEQGREHVINEIKRTIEFAADVARGGPVVVHTGEFPRSIHGIEKKKDGETMFEAYEKEAEEKIHYLVNKRTGEIFHSMKENEVIWEPVKDKNEKDEIIYWEGVTRINPITEEEEKIPKYKLNKRGEIEVEKVTYQEFKKRLLQDPNKKVREEDVPAEFLKAMTTAELEHSLGQADQYEKVYENAKRIRDRIYEAYKKWEKFESMLPEEKRALLKEEQDTNKLKSLGVDVEKQSPAEVLKRMYNGEDKEMRYAEGIAISDRKKAAETARKFREITNIKDYSIEKSADSISKAALYARDVEENFKKHGEKMDRPIFIAPENIFPEQYGGHPDELMDIIDKSRAAMRKALIEKNKLSESEARKIADEKIRATFDVGHVNTWAKYFKGSPDEFKKWILEKTKALVKGGYIGHVHLTDNFGYEDEHLAPGEGNAPIREFVEELRKQGYKGKMMIEPGAQDKGRAHEALLTAMRHFNSPVYSIDGASVSWSDVQHGYFGKVLAGPSYVVGAYAPDIDLPTEHRTWMFWSGVPME